MPKLEPDFPFIRIREVAAFTGLAPATIRKYERLGLVLPHVDKNGGHRIYSQSDVQWLQKLVGYMLEHRLTPKQIAWFLAETPAVASRTSAGLKPCGVNPKHGLACWAANLESVEWRRRCRSCPGLNQRESVLRKSYSNTGSFEIGPLVEPFIQLVKLDQLAKAAYLALGGNELLSVAIEVRAGGKHLNLVYPQAPPSLDEGNRLEPGYHVPIHDRGSLLGLLKFKPRHASWWPGKEHKVSLVAGLLAKRLTAIGAEVTPEIEESRDKRLASLLYEAKSSLSGVALQLDVAEKHAVGESLAARSLGALAKAKLSLRSLRQQVEILSDFALSDSRELPLVLAAFDLTDVLAKVATELEPLATAYGKRLWFEHRVPCTGLWDFARLENALSLLLRWVVKFTADKNVEVSLSSKQGRARLCIAPFSWSAAATVADEVAINDTEVMGAHSMTIALDLARQVSEAHGGHLFVELKRRAMRTVVIELPVRASQPSRQQTFEATTHARKSTVE